MVPIGASGCEVFVMLFFIFILNKIELHDFVSLSYIVGIIEYRLAVGG